MYPDNATTPDSNEQAMLSQPGTPDMVLSGGELLAAALPAAKRGGVDADAVRGLLERAARTIDALYEQNWRTTEEYNQVLARLEQAPAPVAPAPVVPAPAPAVSESPRILAAAERAASEVVAEANAEAQLIRARAVQDRSRSEAEIAELRRQVQEQLRMARADANARRAELADEVRDCEQDANRRIAEVQQLLAEANGLYEARTAELAAETTRINESAARVRAELEAQLEAFRSHARAEREATVLHLVELAESVQRFDPAEVLGTEVPRATAEDIARWQTALEGRPTPAPAPAEVGPTSPAGWSDTTAGDPVPTPDDLPTAADPTMAPPRTDAPLDPEGPYAALDPEGPYAALDPEGPYAGGAPGSWGTPAEPTGGEHHSGATEVTSSWDDLPAAPAAAWDLGTSASTPIEPVVGEPFTQVASYAPDGGYQQVPSFTPEATADAAPEGYGDPDHLA